MALTDQNFQRPTGFNQVNSFKTGMSPGLDLMGKFESPMNPGGQLSSSVSQPQQMQNFSQLFNRKPQSMGQNVGSAYGASKPSFQLSDTPSPSPGSIAPSVQQQQQGTQLQGNSQNGSWWDTASQGWDAISYLMKMFMGSGL